MHRNLKPENILLDIHPDESEFRFTLKISDFSLSRVATVPHINYTPEDPKERERSGREARRLWYRAPELLLRKKSYTEEVDMWTVGCLLGELVLQEPLFFGDHEIEQLLRIFNLLGGTENLREEEVELVEAAPGPAMAEQNIPPHLYNAKSQSVLMPRWPEVPLTYASYPSNTV